MSGRRKGGGRKKTRKSHRKPKVARQRPGPLVTRKERAQAAEAAMRRAGLPVAERKKKVFAKKATKAPAAAGKGGAGKKQAAAGKAKPKKVKAADPDAPAS